LTPSPSNAGEIVVWSLGSLPPPIDRAQSPQVEMESMMQRASVLVVTVRRTIFGDNPTSPTYLGGGALAVFQKLLLLPFQPPRP
jgi:hypothetical protein